MKYELSHNLYLTIILDWVDALAGTGWKQKPLGSILSEQVS